MLPVITEGQTVPPEVAAVAHAILAAEAASAAGVNARSVLNDGIGRAGKPRSERMRKVAEWLADPSTREIFAAGAPGNSHSEWARTVAALAGGGPAHRAFGMDKPGRPQSWSISDGDDLAAAVTHAAQGGAVTVDLAFDSAAKILAAARGRNNHNDGPDFREVTRARSKLKGCSVTGLDEWAEHAGYPRKK